jgi:hypothetical protein
VDWFLGLLVWLVTDGHWKLVAACWVGLAAVGLPYAWWYGRDAWLDREWERLQGKSRRRIRR